MSPKAEAEEAGIGEIVNVRERERERASSAVCEMVQRRSEGLLMKMISSSRMIQWRGDDVQMCKRGCAQQGAVDGVR